MKSATIFMDLFMFMFVVMVLVVTVLASLANQEVLLHIDSTKSSQTKQASSPDISKIGLLEVTIDDAGEHFYVSLTGTDRKPLSSYSELVKYLKNKRPQSIRIRIDRKVSSGVYQDILNTLDKLSIETYQSNDLASRTVEDNLRSMSSIDAFVLLRVA